MSQTPKTLDAEAAKAYLDSHASDAYNLVDVREAWEYEEIHLPGAMLIPLAELADRIGEIPGRKPTLVYCRSGNRSAAAASLITGQGLQEVYNLVGGVMAWKGKYAIGTWDAGLYHFTGKEAPLEILSVAYTMEANLGSFYTTMGIQSQDADLIETFTRLARIEEGHQTVLVKVAGELGALGDVRQALAHQGDASKAEGGWAPEDLLKERSATLQTVQEVVEAAMMFEVQALDLYLRSAVQIKNEEGRELLQRLADQEKEHLKVLARLLNRERSPKKD